jgi:uncharacterized RDD family membrane protein YckC
MVERDLTQRRLAAWLLDAAIAAGLISLLQGLGWLAALAYWMLRDGLFHGQSVGKRLMGLRVAGAHHPPPHGPDGIDHGLQGS